MMKKKDKEVGTDDTDEVAMRIGPVSIRQVVADMGINPNLATMVTPNLFFTPGESDPSSQNMMVIVQGIQKCLNELGFKVPRNGLLNAATQNAIAQVVGRNWMAVPWLHIYKVCKYAKTWNLKPKKNIPRWKQQRTAIGEPVSLGASTTPLDALIPYTLPSTAIECVGSGSAEYCYGKTMAVAAAFKKLQSVVGVSQDGKIGPVTAKATVDKARSLWYDRFNRKLLNDEVNHLSAVVGAWDKYQRPFVVAASADKTAAILSKYLGTASKLLSAITSVLRHEETTTPPPNVVMDSPSLLSSGFGTGTIAVIGLGALAAWHFFGPKRKKR